MTVEMDESSFTKKRKYGRGKMHQDRWVFGITERDATGQRRGRKSFLLFQIELVKHYSASY